MSIQIVVGDDFGAPGRLAILEALRRGTNAHLHVCHVLEESRDAGEMDAAFSAASKKLWERIANVGMEVIGLTAANISINVRFGDPGEVLEQMAADYRADLVIVGTKDERGLKSLGSVATHLIHNATCSVLVARPQRHKEVAPTERPAPPTPGTDLHEERHSDGLVGTQRMSWNPSGKGTWRMY
jgi:nucleotide-binding universal stress UspA family protein